MKVYQLNSCREYAATKQGKGYTVEGKYYTLSEFNRTFNEKYGIDFYTLSYTTKSGKKVVKNTLSKKEVVLTILKCFNNKCQLFVDFNLKRIAEVDKFNSNEYYYSYGEFNSKNNPFTTDFINSL